MTDFFFAFAKGKTLVFRLLVTSSSCGSISSDVERRMSDFLPTKRTCENIVTSLSQIGTSNSV